MTKYEELEAKITELEKYIFKMQKANRREDLQTIKDLISKNTFPARKLIDALDLGSNLSQLKRLNSMMSLANLLEPKADSALTIFDVGAHIGKKTIKFREYFPNATVFCFEPFDVSFERLKSAKIENTKCFNFGFSDKVEMSEFKVNKWPPTNSLLPLSDKAQETWGNHPGMVPVGSVTCQFETLDNFIKLNDIKHINILKIDVQGAEFKVLEGGKKSLKQGVVGLVMMEIILGDSYKGQKSLSYYLDVMDTFGFKLHNMCDQEFEHTGQLLYFDAIFKHKSFH